MAHNHKPKIRQGDKVVLLRDIWRVPNNVPHWVKVSEEEPCYDFVGYSLYAKAGEKGIVEEVFINREVTTDWVNRHRYGHKQPLYAKVKMLDGELKTLRCTSLELSN